MNTYIIDMMSCSTWIPDYVYITVVHDTSELHEFETEKNVLYYFRKRIHKKSSFYGSLPKHVIRFMMLNITKKMA